MDTIKVYGYSVGDSSVGIGSIEFSIDTGLCELSEEDKQYIIEGILRDVWELHDNGDLKFEFSDEADSEAWDYARRLTYRDSERILNKKQGLLNSHI